MLLTASPAFAWVFPWPDPRQHPRVILTADQKLGDFLDSNPEWFVNDFLVAGLTINTTVYGESEDMIENRRILHDKLQYHNIAVGSAVSGTTVQPELTLTQYPDNAVSLEDMSVYTRYLGQWTRDPKQQVVDISDLPSRRELQNGIRDLWQNTLEIVRFVDNAAVHPGVAHMQPWASYCENMKDIREFAHNNRETIVFNVFMRSWELTDTETLQLISAVGYGNAISLPLPWSKSIKNNKNANGWAIFRYQQMLNNGIVLIFIPSNDAPEKDLYEWLATWRRPSDHVYLALPYWKEPLSF